MKLLRTLLPIACMFAVAACCNEPKTARLTPRIPIYNSQGLPGHEHTKDTQNILGHPVIVKDGWLQPWMNYDTMFVWSMNFIIDGPVYESPDGLLPGYLVTSSYGSDETPWSRSRLTSLSKPARPTCLNTCVSPKSLTSVGLTA